MCRLLESNKRKQDDDSVEQEEDVEGKEEYLQSACYKAKRRCHALEDGPVLKPNSEFKIEVIAADASNRRTSFTVKVEAGALIVMTISC